MVSSNHIPIGLIWARGPRWFCLVSAKVMPLEFYLGPWGTPRVKKRKSLGHVEVCR